MQEKFFGTVVTEENFLEWRKKFDEDMRARKSTEISTQPIGLTGNNYGEGGILPKLDSCLCVL